MKIRVNTILAAIAAVLAMGLFVACGPGSSSGSGESGSPRPTSNPTGQESSGIGASGQQDAPAGTATVTPIAAAGQQSDPVDTATITPIHDGQTQGTAPASDLSVSTATAAPVLVMPPSSSRELVIDVTQYRQLLPRDAIAPVYDAQFVSAESAALRPDELVIGVEINGESKAYPVGPLNYREMVNDTVGGVPVLVTW